MSQKSSQIFIKNSTIFFGVPWCSFSSYFTAAFLNNKILNSYQYAYILARTNMPGWWILFISHQLGWWVKNNILDTEIGLHCTSLMQILIQILSLCYSPLLCGVKQKWEQMSWRRIWKLRNDRDCPKNIWQLHNKEHSHFWYIYFIDCAVIFQVTRAICQKLW